jgi:hypothetical protein
MSDLSEISNSFYSIGKESMSIERMVYLLMKQEHLNEDQASLVLQRVNFHSVEAGLAYLHNKEGSRFTHKPEIIGFANLCYLCDRAVDKHTSLPSAPEKCNNCNKQQA